MLSRYNICSCDIYIIVCKGVVFVDVHLIRYTFLVMSNLKAVVKIPDCKERGEQDFETKQLK